MPPSSPASHPPARPPTSKHSGRRRRSTCSGWCRISHRFPPDPANSVPSPNHWATQARGRCRRSALARALFESIRPARWTIRHVSRRIHVSARAKPIKHILFARKMSLKASRNAAGAGRLFCLRHTLHRRSHRRDASNAPQSLTQVPHAQGTTVTGHSQLLSAWASDHRAQQELKSCEHRSADRANVTSTRAR